MKIGLTLFRHERQKNMSVKRGQGSSSDGSKTVPEDWDNAFVTHSMDELRAEVASRRTRGPNKLPVKEQVAVRYSPEVLAFFRSTGTGWQTRMDEVLRDYVAKRSKK
jgi:uncharacterized protein (DUF4415 family)